MANVKIYSTPTCTYCVMTKEYLKENNVEYTDIDVSVDHAAGEEMVKKSGQMGVPVIVIEKDGHEEVLVGFQQEKIANLLGL